MTDIFHEVEEEVRREKLQKLWKQYGDYIIAGVSVVLIGVAGWQFWTRYENGKKAEASATYQNAHTAAAGNDLKGALTQFDKLKDAPGGYAELSALSDANTLAATGKINEAVAAYRSFADKYKDTLADVARIRAGWLMADSATVAGLTAVLKPVADKTDGFGPMAREVIAYGYYRTGDLKEAQKRFEALALDAQAPQSVTYYSNAMAGFIKSGGATNYGTVPPVAPEKPAAPAGAPTL